MRFFFIAYLYFIIKLAERNYTAWDERAASSRLTAVAMLYS